MQELKKKKKKEKRNRWSRGGLSFSIMATIKKEPFAFRCKDWVGPTAH